MKTVEGKLVCRYCKLPIEPQQLSFVNAYWVGHGMMIRSFEHPDRLVHVAAERKFPCHRDCKREGFRAEAYECQCIDRACNDCKHYERQGRPVKPKPLPQDRKTSDDEQLSYLIAAIAASADSFGLCRKYNKRVTANPQSAEMMPCFEHRRA